MSALAVDLEWDGETILCASTCFIMHDFFPAPQVWVNATGDGYIPMTTSLLEALIEFLWMSHKSGTTIVTWGGTGSDFKALATACPKHFNKCKEMALKSIDIPFLSVCQSGMMQSLVSTAHANGMVPRISCASSDVPKMWKLGIIAQADVLSHVQWDSWACAQIYHKLLLSSQLSRPQLSWSTQRSGIRTIRLPREKVGDFYRLPTVEEALLLPTPISGFTIPEHLQPKTLTAWMDKKKSILNK